MTGRLGKCDVISIEDLSIGDVERIFASADRFIESMKNGVSLDHAAGLIMATLFYEPSTRTRLSFESAMHRLGGAVISAPDMQTSSAAKGESLADTVRVVASYADLIVLRHPHDGAARVAAEYAPCPVINAGDGSREHPTQTLCDLYVLRKKKGRLKDLTVAICGDLKYGRTVHSLIYALARFGANILAVPNKGMDVPGYVLDRLAAERGYSFSTVGIDELKSLAGGLDALYLTPSAPHQMALFTGEGPPPKLSGEKGPAALDAFYVTRLQRERLSSEEAGEDEGYLRFDARALKTSRAHEAVVMHPLPRTGELAYELDTDPRAVYFEQAAAGVPVRMALISWMLDMTREQPGRASQKPPPIRFNSEPAPRCPNPNCVTRHEVAYLRPRFRLSTGLKRDVLMLRCDLCDRELRVEFVGHARSHRYYRYDESLLGYVRQWIDEASLVVFDNVKQAEEAGYEPYRRGPQREIMNAQEVASACEALARQIVEGLPDLGGIAIAGVVSHGALLAIRLRDLIEELKGVRLPCAAIDSTGAKDELHPLDGTSQFEIEGKTIILVDDVINSGWTIQRAMTALWKRGRPAAVRLAVLIDRGHRAVPIRANYVGKHIPTSRAERVRVKLEPPPPEPGYKPSDRVVVYSMVESMKPHAEKAK